MALNANIKPVVLAQTAAAVVEASLVVPNLMTKVGIEEFRGASSDTVNVKVPGVLPAHDLAWRTERVADVTLDSFSERTMAVSFQGNVYQATKLQDEQVDFDNLGWQRVVPLQAEAVARNLEMKAVTQLGAPTFPGNVSLAGVTGSASAYAYQIGATKSGRNLRTSLIAMRRVANAIQMDSSRTLVIGPDIEAAILSDTSALGLASALVSGPDNANAALREATIGRLLGMNVVVAPELSGVGYLVTSGAFVMASAAPSAPASVPFAATASARGVSVRWLRDYDALRMTDRSVVNTYVGFRAVPDPVFIRGSLYGGTADAISTGEYFIRAIKLNFSGASATGDVLPAATSELAYAFGISTNTAL